MKLKYLIIYFFFFSILVNAQEYYGGAKVCGLDKKTQLPLADTFIVLFTKDKIYKLLPDADGCVLIKNVPVGKYEVKLIVSGYQPLQFDNILVGEAKTCYLVYQLNRLESGKAKKRKTGKQH